jgi:hypothetical protein
MLATCFSAAPVGYPAGTVKRAHSYANGARRLLTSWVKKVGSYFGFLHLQFAIVAPRTAGVLGKPPQYRFTRRPHDLMGTILDQPPCGLIG